MSYIERFLEAQEKSINTVISELKAGKKKSHWMWYVFPQIASLGYSPTAKYYGIKTIDQAVAFITNSELSANYLDCLEALLSHKYKPISKILGDIDSLKLKSSLTLFKATGLDERLVGKITTALNHFFDGEECKKTLVFLSDSLSDQSN